MTFEVGDKVIYPNHGLGIVERIEEKTILGTTCGFYHLRIVANETTVLVPVEQRRRRRPSPGDQRRRSRAAVRPARRWQDRQPSELERAGSRTTPTRCAAGPIYDVADVLKSLTFLAKSKSLSFREKRMLDRAKFLIISEVSEVMRETAPRRSKAGSTSRSNAASRPRRALLPGPSGQGRQAARDAGAAARRAARRFQLRRDAPLAPRTVSAVRHGPRRTCITQRGRSNIDAGLFVYHSSGVHRRGSLCHHLCRGFALRSDSRSDRHALARWRSAGRRCSMSSAISA